MGSESLLEQAVRAIGYRFVRYRRTATQHDHARHWPKLKNTILACECGSPGGQVSLVFGEAVQT